MKILNFYTISKPVCFLPGETISLYSTAMQNLTRNNTKFSCWGLDQCEAPTREFRVGDTNMLLEIVRANMLVSKNAKICVTPNANPKREQVEYNFRAGHVDFFFFGTVFQWNMG